MEEYFDVMFSLWLLMVPTFLSGFLMWKAGIKAGKAAGRNEVYEKMIQAETAGKEE